MKTRSFLRAATVDAAALLIADSVVLFLGLLIGDLIVHAIHGLPISSQYSLAVIPVWWIGALIARVVPVWGLGAVEELRRIQLLLLSVFALAGVAVFLSHGQMVPSRIVYLVSYLFSALFIPLMRLPVKKTLLLLGCWGCPTAIYGSSAQVKTFFSDFIATPFLGYVPGAIFTNGYPPGSLINGIPVRGSVTESGAEFPVAVVPVSVAEPLSGSQDFDRVFSGYRKVVLIPDIKEDIFLWAVPRTLGGLIGLEITSNLFNPLARMIKRGMDLSLVLLTLPLWLPLIAVVALLITVIDRHSPFFLQHRMGRRNRPFRPVKFRTMRAGAEQELEEMLGAGGPLREEWKKNCKLREDPRVTPLGKILRRTSLDELPQVLNVLAGQMSLVGPRPLPDYHHEQLTEFARAPRSRVRPGITGLWQVSGRSDSGTAGMEKWDTYYVRNWSVWLDIVILARTARVVLLGSGAY